jgi:hypothetical protein
MVSVPAWPHAQVALFLQLAVQKAAHVFLLKDSLGKLLCLPKAHV